MEGKAYLDGTHKSHLVGCAELNGVVRLLCATRCSAMVCVCLLARLALLLAGSAYAVAIATAFCDDGNLHSLVRNLVGLHCHTYQGNGLGSIELGHPRNLGSLRLTRGECVIYRTLCLL